MSDDFPTWPPEWLEDRDLAAEETVAEVGPISFVTALRADDRVLMSVRWPEGRRYLLVDPVGNEAPAAYRIGERSEDVDTARAVEAVWSQALAQAKALMDGELPEPPPEEPRRRRWRR